MKLTPSPQLCRRRGRTTTRRRRPGPSQLVQRPRRSSAAPHGGHCPRPLNKRVRDLIAADPPDEHFIQTLWAMQATGQLTDEVRSRNPTLVQAWALAEANPPPHQLQAMLAALAAQHLNAAEAAEAA